MLNRLLLFLILSCCAFASFPQAGCGFDILHKKALANDPAYRRMISDQKQYVKNQLLKKKSLRTMVPQAVQYTIPVVVHVVHTGGAIGTAYNPTQIQIQNAIAHLNSVFDGTKPGTEGVGDIEIRFALATLDPSCNVSTGITRTNGSSITNYASNGVNINLTGGTAEINVKNLIRWDPKKYYNIWVVSEIDNHDGTIPGSFIGGFAYLPGAPPTLDGTVILASQMIPNAKTLPHEIGHAMGLYHPFEGGTSAVCPANADCNVDGDEVCDTDPVTQPPIGVCRTGLNSCAGIGYSINTEHNYMNYTNCSTLFTQGQKDRMLTFAGSPYRISLNSSWGASVSYPVNPFVAPVAASCTPVTSPAGLAGHYAGLMGFELGGRVMVSGTSMMDGGYLNGTTNCQNLIELTRGNTYPIQLRPLAINYEQLRGWIDYNNNGIFDNATEQIVFEDAIGPPDLLNIIVSGSFQVPVTAVTNTVLRLRITEELSTLLGAGFAITGGCYNPAYGQAEDYPVIISDQIVLPVSYEYFNAVVSGRSVSLKWKTLTEENAAQFVLERASLGHSFDSIGKIDARGLPSVYSFVDGHPGAGTWYYRIRQEDADGKIKYSAVRAVQLTSTQLKLVNNPFREKIELRLSEPLKENAEIRLVGVTGKTWFQKKLQATGQFSITLDLSSYQMPAGIYFLEYRIGQQKIVEKVVKQ